MRNSGIVLLLLGILGFFYCGDQASRHAPVPEGLGIRAALSYTAARWEMGRYGCAAAAGIGFLLALFPKGR